MEQQKKQASNKVLLLRLYQKTSKAGTVFWTGTLGASSVIVFENTRKQNEKDADLMVYAQENEKREYPNKGFERNAGRVNYPRPVPPDEDEF